MAGFKRGAIVRLRSGGPEMTIEKIATDPACTNRQAACVWFDKQRLRSGKFLLHSLVPKGAPDGEDCTDDELAEQEAATTVERAAEAAAMRRRLELLRGGE